MCFLLPWAYMEENHLRLVILFSTALMGLFIGVSLFSLNMLRCIEHIVASICLMWEKSAVRSLVAKNLDAHRIRNRRITVMFSIGLTFWIFLASMFDLELQTLTLQRSRVFGARLNLFQSDLSIPFLGLSSPDLQAKVLSIGESIV